MKITTQVHCIHSCQVFDVTSELGDGAGALARGDALINLRFPHAGYREKIWDHVAGVVIVTEAGATVSDASGDGTISAHDASLVGGLTSS